MLRHRPGREGKLVSTNDSFSMKGQIPSDERPLTIERLDELSALALAGATNRATQKHAAIELSAYMEWYWLQRSGHDFGSLLKHGSFGDFDARLRSRVETWMTARMPARGFLRVRRKRSDVDHLNWSRFRYSLHKSARAAGFSVAWAGQIVGALGELEENIHCHSQAAKTAILAYWFSGADLEIVVLDMGIGVLQSLRMSEEYRHLVDHGTAIRLATQDGTSRFDRGSGHGWGFHDLFAALANSRATIRIRSGDHLLRVEGRTGLPASQLHQRAAGQGVLISVRASAVRG